MSFSDAQKKSYITLIHIVQNYYKRIMSCRSGQ